MKLFRLPWQALILTVLALCLNGTAQGQDGAIIMGNPQGGGGGSIEIVSSDDGNGFSLAGGYPFPTSDAIGFLPNTNWATVSSLQVAPGSSLVLNVDFFGGGTAALHSFSLDFKDEPYLTWASFTANLPTGYTSSFANHTFTGQNVNGTDISANPTITTNSLGVKITTDTVTSLGTLTFTIDPNAPIGTVLSLPVPTAFSFLDASGNQLNMGDLQFLVGPTVAAPELPVSTMISLTLLALAILAWAFPRLGPARA